MRIMTTLSGLLRELLQSTEIINREVSGSELDTVTALSHRKDSRHFRLGAAENDSAAFLAMNRFNEPIKGFPFYTRTIFEFQS